MTETLEQRCIRIRNERVEKKRRFVERYNDTYCCTLSLHSLTDLRRDAHADGSRLLTHEEARIKAQLEGLLRGGVVNGLAIRKTYSYREMGPWGEVVDRWESGGRGAWTLYWFKKRSRLSFFSSFKAADEARQLEVYEEEPSILAADVAAAIRELELRLKVLGRGNQ